MMERNDLVAPVLRRRGVRPADIGDILRKSGASCRMRNTFAAALIAAGAVGVAAAQVPDNTGLRPDADETGPPAYESTIRTRNEQRLEDARAAGETYIPIVRGSPKGAAERSPEAAPPEIAPEPEEPAPAFDSPSPPMIVPDGEDRLAVQIGVLLETLGRPPQTVRVRYPLRGERPVASSPVREPRRQVPTATTIPGVRAGDGLYARTVYAVNSDHDGPVVLEILQPPLAGAVATGRFERVRDRLVVRIDRLEFRGRAIAVDAWAVDLACACYGVAGDVDRHWFERLLLPAAVRFAEGFFAAHAEPEETIRLEDGAVYETSRRTPRQAVLAGAGNAARTAGDILLQDAPTAATVRIPRNSELVLMFARSPGGSRASRSAVPPPPFAAGERGDE